VSENNLRAKFYKLTRAGRKQFQIEEENWEWLDIERGMSPEEAEREARRCFGNVGYIKDLGRDIKGGGFIETLWQEQFAQDDEPQFGAVVFLEIS
jgi:DNA-binding MarR family transcriptional regulator